MDKRELKKLIKEVKEEKDNFLLVSPALRPLKEVGFSRLRRIMLGHVPSVETAALLTAENPAGGEGKEMATAQHNNKAMASLEKRLKNMNLVSGDSKITGFTKIKGSFGGPETSLFVPNISREETINLGRDYNQTAVIWGEKGKSGFRWEYITLLDDNDQPLSTPRVDDVKSVSLSTKDVQGREDFYSQKGSRKFLIPFFDDDHNEPDDPEEPISEAWESFEARLLMETINERVKRSCQPDVFGRTRWHYRGLIKNDLKRLLEMLDGV